jgi:hypothetical protein
LGGVFQNYLQAVLPAILDGKIFQYLSLHLAHWFSNNLLLLGLADENESVRDAALSAGHVFVEHYATTYALLFELVTWFFAAYKGRPGAVVRGVSLSHQVEGSKQPLRICWGKDLPWFIPSLDPIHVGAFDTGYAFFIDILYDSFFVE